MIKTETAKTPYLFVGCPSYDGTIHGQTATSLMAASRTHGPVRFRVGSASLLAHNFNALWCTAINDPLATHFGMIHADIAADFYWLDTMLDIMDARKLTVLSALVPMKTGNGLTSTALDTPEHRRNGPTQQRRLTMREAYRLSETFDAADVCNLFGLDPVTWFGGEPRDRALLVNTGLMVVDLQPFRAGLWFPGFDITSRILKEADGSLGVSTEPEDWAFSRWCTAQGLATACTRAVRVDHVGGHVNAPNDSPWGDWETDEDYAASLLAVPVPDTAIPQTPIDAGITT